MIFTQPINSIYIHIPFCLRKCHYCVFPVHFLGKTPNSPLIPFYLSSLQSEISHSLNIYSKSHLKNNLKSLYFGGGTPSLLSASNMEQLMTLIKNYYIINHETEVSMELNPGTFDENKIKMLMELGINRF